jgi:hypothetical protein
MKATEAAKLLANRINQEHYILHIMQKVYEAGVQDGKKQANEKQICKKCKSLLTDGLCKNRGCYDADESFGSVLYH